ncbi:helix-turn-helix domain-containing protein [Fodinicurvata halophila]|uniref:Helix-turn-helix domain-containing protein n=1 Tax=Fodinicurvata halophila TaxID=1419723 RepID=A0ABV8UNU1_9PROT
MLAPTKTWFTVSECATNLGVSSTTIRRAIRRGELGAHKGQKLVRISVRDWRLYLAEHWPEVSEGALLRANDTPDAHDHQ